MARSSKQGLPIRFSNYSIIDDSNQIKVNRLYNFFNQTGDTEFTPLVDQQFHVEGLDGIVNQGELLLIIGPPSSNTNILLRSLSAPNDLQRSDSSHLDYGLLPPSMVTRPTFRLGKSNDQHGRLRSEIVFLSEHDVHFPHLSVEASLMPGSVAKVPSARSRDDKLSRREWAKVQLTALLKSTGLSHAVKTKMGSGSVQGLSGGERKRASIVESLLTRASVLLLESPINGLDSASALSLLAFLRDWTKTSNRSLVATTPHIADNLFAQFDKVLVLNSTGHQIYFGSISSAQPYFERLGFVRKSATEGIAEFIVNCNEGLDNDLELQGKWESSSERVQLMLEMASYEKRYHYSHCAAPLLAAVEEEKSRFQSNTSPYMINFLPQVVILTRRQYSLIISELPTYVTKTTVNVLLSLLVGTVFFALPPETDAAFTRGGLLLLSIMFNAYLSLGELGKAIEGRELVKRQREYGFFGASALSVARVAGDLPLIGVQVLLFGSMTYLLAGLQRSLEKFLIYILFVYVMALNLSSMFRLFASLSPSFDVAIRYCGLSLNVLVIYAGYFIPTPSMMSGLKFIHYVIDPISYAFEAVLTNEFHDLELACSSSSIVPFGASYTNQLYQTCALPGSIPGSLIVLGDDYLSKAYDFHHDRIWFNLGVLIVQALVFLVGSIIATDILEFTHEGNKQVFLRPSSYQKIQEEDIVAIAIEEELLTHTSVLSWSHISLWVDTELDTRKLLDNINGYVKGGSITALMGVSGAGKSTLLNVLAGRSNAAAQKGDILIDGCVPTEQFFRTTGFVQQFDHHDDRATVREALEFSALLRQDASLSKSEKLAYVDIVLDLLDLSPLEHALIGTNAAGLNTEQRKRLTIAVEVVARPAILFCDEPTTNLDTKSALRVVKLLHKLSRTGIAVIATIHQPSTEAFNMFDNLLLLEQGGRQVYFGPRSAALDYFDMASDTPDNPAEILLHIASSENDVLDITSPLSTKWRLSPQAAASQATIGALSTAVLACPLPVKAPGVLQQCYELTKRVSRHFYRDPSFSYTKVATATSVATIIGLSFFGVGRELTIVSFQNRMFTIFLVLFIPPVFMNLVIFKQHRLRGLFDQREGPSKIYGETAFVTSLIISELPYSIICGSIYFCIFYFLVGFPLAFSTVGYAFLMVQLFFFFQSTWAMWITALAPELGTIANLLPFFLVSAEVFNGALMPYSSMPFYWRWLYWISPFQWYVRGLLGVLLHDVPVVCSENELVAFLSPPGETCLSYACEYLQTSAGYLLDSSATVCSYCRLSKGDDFLSTLNINYSDRYRSLIIFAAYTISNVALVYFFTYFPPQRLQLTTRTKSRAEIAMEMEGELERDRLQEEAAQVGIRGGL